MVSGPGALNFLGVGSGIDFQGLLDSIIKFESRSLNRIQKEIDKLGLQRDAFNDINGRLDTLRDRMAPLITGTAADSAFGKISATSSDALTLTATAASTASPGTYDVRVQRLALAHQAIATQGATVASFTAQITGSDLNPNIDPSTTLLKSLHRRDNGLNVATANVGTIVVDDSRLGAGTTIDLAAAGITENSTWSSLLTAVNTALTADGSNASAAMNAAGTGILITDTGAGPENLTISDSVGTLGAGLGINGVFPNAVPITVNGGDLNPELQGNTPLSVLRGGAGPGAIASGVVLRSGTSLKTLSFSGATTVQNLLDPFTNSGYSVNGALNAAKNGIAVTATIANRSVAIDENSGTTALDLGIIGEDRVLRVKTSADAAFTRVFLNGGFDGNNANLSQADVRDSVNAAFGSTGKVSGSLVNGRLIFASKETGLTGALQFQDDLLGAGTLEQLGVLTTDPLTNNVISAAYAGDQTKGGTMVAAVDASFSVNGLALTRSKNTGITDVISGVTMNLLKVSTSTGPVFPTDFAPTTLTVTPDRATTKTEIKKFVDQFNSAVDFIRDQTKSKNEKISAGVLYGDNAAEALKTGLVSRVSGRVNDPALVFKSLFDVVDKYGKAVFKLDKDNLLVLDETALDNVLADKGGDLEKLFAYDSNGDAVKDKGLLFDLDTYLKAEAKPDGLLDKRAASIKEVITQRNERLTRETDRLDAREASLKSQFTSAEMALNRLKSTQTSLSSQLSRVR